MAQLAVSASDREAGHRGSVAQAGLQSVLDVEIQKVPQGRQTEGRQARTSLETVEEKSRRRTDGLAVLSGGPFSTN